MTISRRKPEPKSAEIVEHERRLRELGCCITGKANPELHHCRAGSMKEAGFSGGTARRPSHWLQIPLDVSLHSAQHPEGIHRGVVSWEAKHGAQVLHLTKLSLRLGYDVLARARADTPAKRYAKPSKINAWRGRG